MADAHLVLNVERERRGPALHAAGDMTYATRARTNPAIQLPRCFVRSRMRSNARRRLPAQLQRGLHLQVAPKLTYTVGPSGWSLETPVRAN